MSDYLDDILAFIAFAAVMLVPVWVVLAPVYTGFIIMQRTTQQNRAAHKYFSLMAQALNEAGYDQKKFFDMLKDGFNIKWSSESFKDFYRSVAISLYPEITSTADLTTKQMMNAYEVVDRGISELTGVRIDWPCDEPPLMEEHDVT